MRMFVTAEGLAQLVTDLDRAWDFLMTDVDGMVFGLPIRVQWNNTYGLFRVYLYPDQVKALNTFVPTMLVEERYGTDHNAHRPTSSEHSSS